MMLRMESIQKRFFGKYANRNVNLNVEAGEIHALLKGCSYGIRKQIYA